VFGTLKTKTIVAALGLILVAFSSNFAVDVGINCRIRNWDLEPIEGAVGKLSVAGITAVSDESGWMYFRGELGARGLRLSSRRFSTLGADKKAYSPSGRLILSEDTRQLQNLTAWQFLVYENRSRGGSLALSNDKLVCIQERKNNLGGGIRSSASRLVSVGLQATVLDTVYVEKEGYHRERQFVFAYNNGKSFFLVPLPPSDSIPSGMVHVPEGEFFMGSQDGDPDETPVRRVHLSSFYMDTVEVTQGEYETVMGATPWNSIAGTGREDIGPEYPAWGISWYDAVLFCNKKSKAEGRDTVYEWTSIEGTPGDGATISNVEIHLERRGYRLPTEAEWEYACRGGGNTEYMWGTDKNAGDAYAWYQDNSGYHTHKVAQKDPNWFNIYDIVGNVYEWANDWYGRNYNSETTNPLETRPGSSRIIRGGCYLSPPVNLSVSDRAGGDPAVQHETQGFRTVLSDW
jgi:formylglycine-generating enzyme required for sulfatase activity